MLPVSLPTTEQSVLILVCIYMAVFLFEKMFKVIKYFREASNNTEEIRAKTLSRDYLLQTKNDAAYLRVKFDTLYSAVMKEHDGSLLIYNKGLEKIVSLLNNNIINLTEAIKNLAK